VRDSLSVVLITRNEQDEIEECLEGVSWADEIVVVDSRSTDRTVELARRFTDRVFVKDFAGFTEQKRYATSLANGPWILNVDADERVTPDLRDEILALLDRPGACAGYRMARLTWYLGAFIRHGTWYPDAKLRLFRKNAGRWVGESVHESLEVSGPIGALEHPLLHYSFRTLRDHLDTIDRFTRLAADDLAARGEGGAFVHLLAHPPATFIKSYVLRLGFLDGWRGLVIAALSARHAYLKYARARRAIRDARRARRAK
jgi:glycosyltransferase involved in cell wall biosynthesis